jgi:tetratricopeptide (TPR) repeat protein
MPTRDSISEFNRTLVTLGNEPAVRARRGEEIEEVAPPEEGLSEDLSELLGTETGPEGEEEAFEEAGFEDAGPGEAEPPGAPAPPEEPEPEEGEFDLGDLEDFDLGEVVGEGEEAAAEEPGPAEAAAEEPDAEGPELPGTPEAGEELDVGDIDIDEELSALGLEGEEAPGGEEARGGEEPPGGEEPRGGEEPPGGAEAPAESEAPEAPEAAGEEALGEEDIEDLGDLVSGEELAGLTEPEEEEEEGLGAAEAEEPEDLEAADVEEEGGFEEPEEFDLSAFAEDFDFSPEEAEVPDFEEGDFEEGDFEESGFEEEALEEEPEAEAEAGPGEEPLAPQEAEEFSFDFAEEEVPEPTPGGEELEEPEIEAPEPGGETEEDFTFEDESFELPPGEEFEEPAAGPPAGEEVGEEDLDEFSLGDFGAEFGVLEEADESTAEEEAELNPALDVSGAPPPTPQDAAAPEVELTDEEFAALQQNLNALPLNLKLAVEEAIGEQHGGPERTERLVRMLVEGETPRHIADATGKILARRIEVPRGYEKRTGVHFEERRQSFAYRFRENILPIVRVVGMTALALALVSFLAYRFVYRPLHARNLYEQGLDRIEAERYAAGNELFEEAVDVWPVKTRFYEYAEAFETQRRYDLARGKYEQALRRYPGDKAGMLGYARMESELSNHEQADNLIRVFLEGTGFPGGGYIENREFMSEIMDIPADAVPRVEGRPFDYDGLLLRGNNFMSWAQEDPRYYENARLAYARALEQHGRRPELLFAFTRYFIETDNLEEVERLAAEFQAQPDLEIETDTYARMGGYLIDRGSLDRVREILTRAIETEEERGGILPSGHYHLARYFRDLDDPVEEKIALDNALLHFEALAEMRPLERREIAQYVDTHGRLGEYYYEEEEFLTARNHFTEAISRYERAQEQLGLESQPRFGRIYARYGDLLYYVSREYEDARANFALAEANGYSSRNLDYKQGFIHYRNGEYQTALENFFDAAGDYSRNRSVLYATANALYQRESLGAAQGYYAELLDVLEAERERIETLLVEEDPEHRGLVEYLIKVQNNLGVTLQRLAQRGPDNGDVSSQGLVYLEAASEDAVNYNRDPRTGERAPSVNLAYLNMREILYPQPEYDLQIYTSIPKDLDDVDF